MTNLKEFVESHKHPGDSEYLIKCTRRFRDDKEEEELNQSVCEWVKAFMKNHPLISTICIVRVNEGKE